MANLSADLVSCRGMTRANQDEDELILVMRELEEIRSLARVGQGVDDASNVALDSVSDRAWRVMEIIRSLSETRAFKPEEL